jgi:signal transduction histidine kinase
LAYHLQLPEEEPTLSSEATIGLFRIVQEALTNIVRYAKAKNVWIELSSLPNEVLLRVRDDGIGIPDKAGHKVSHGLLGMRERVMALKGDFKIETAAGRGTSVVVRVPAATPAVSVAPALAVATK